MFMHSSHFYVKKKKKNHYFEKCLWRIYGNMIFFRTLYNFQMAINGKLFSHLNGIVMASNLSNIIFLLKKIYYYRLILPFRSLGSIRFLFFKILFFNKNTLN